jgi:hypothetical protein
MMLSRFAISRKGTRSLAAGLLVAAAGSATPGCGSRSAPSAESTGPCGSDGGVSLDAGPAATDGLAPPDASTSDAGCSPALLASLEQQLIAAATPPGPSFALFSATADYLAYFRVLAVGSNEAAAFCAPGNFSAYTSCAYDPTRTADGPADIHHSNGLNQFVGPDGQSWAWAYFGGLAFSNENVWVFGNEQRTPQMYGTILEYNSCLVAIDGH